jgi:hypothetical protein
MPNVSDAASLRQIADELAALYAERFTIAIHDPVDTLAISQLIRKAITLRAFSGQEWASLRAKSLGLATRGARGGEDIEAMLAAVPIVWNRTGRAVDNLKDLCDAIVSKVRAATSRLEAEDALGEDAERGYERTGQAPSSPSPEAGRTAPREYNPDASALMLPALRTHHQYEASEGRDSIGNYNPISLRELKERYGIKGATASRWFKNNFGSHADYKRACKRNRGRPLFEALRRLSEEDPAFDTGADPDQIADPAGDDEVADRELADDEAQDDEE